MASEQARLTNDERGFPESNTHSFIIKVWLEETSHDVDAGIWRGRITHVLTGKRQYVKSLGEMVSFMDGYFRQMGVKLSLLDLDHD